VIALSDVEYLITLILASAYIKGERPLSAMLTSQVESGKSSLLYEFEGNRWTEWVSDATAWGIAKNYGKKLKSGELRHLLFPEFSMPSSKKYETVSGLDAYLTGLIEEGIGKITTFALKDIETRAPYGCGIILCISKEDLALKRKRWFRIGFLSRLIPISYTYNEPTKKAIRNYIKLRQYQQDKKVKLELPPEQQEIELPIEFADRLENLVPRLIEGTNLFGFRWQRHLQRLAMANALISGRDIVNLADYDKVESLTEYMNTDCHKEI